MRPNLVERLAQLADPYYGVALLLTLTAGVALLLLLVLS